MHHYNALCAEWLHAVARRMEFLMSIESDAARAELAHLQGVLANFINTHSQVVQNAAAAAQEAADNKAALADVTAGMTAMLGQINQASAPPA